MQIDSFKHDDWTQIWAGKWSLLTCSHFGDEYTKEIKFYDHIFMSQSIIIIQEGKSAAWMRQNDRDTLGNLLASQVKKEPKLLQSTCETLKAEVDKVLDFMDKYDGKEIDGTKYKEYWERILRYYIPHIFVKYVADYLDPKELKDFLPILEEARVYAEPVFKRTEDFVIKVAEIIGRKHSLKSELILCMTKEEFFIYFETNSLPSVELLKARYHKAVMIFDKKDFMFVPEKNQQEVENFIATPEEIQMIKGQSAYKGFVKGRVRIVHDPTKAEDFEAGDILVTGMTRPEFLYLMQKSAAIITNAGGILSHAAITARELKKPCIIGTQVATKLLKDGDLVEVDADNGIVRKV